MNGLFQLHRTAYVLFFMEALVCTTAFSYNRASEGGENVKSKIYPRLESFDLSGQGGMVLNQSYVNTIALNVGLEYHFSNTWGFGLDYASASNSDKEERTCIESFYNDPNGELSSPCGDRAEIDALGSAGAANFGPAYVPVREIQNILTLNMIWSPVYGKQLILYSATSYFDLYTETGVSLVNSVFYPKQVTLRNGNRSRGSFNPDGSQPTPPLGASPDQTDSYGVEGRPDAESQSNVAANLGVGMKFHFAGHFHLKAALRNITLVGTESSVENLFILYCGLGVRF